MQKGDNYKNGITPFEQKWGISANDLAQQENVSTPAIHMRVKLYGTPFQRKSKPTNIERKYGKTIFEIAKEIGVHPMSVVMREHHFNNAYREGSYPHPTRGKKLKENPTWRKNARKVFWIHPNHPDYEQARNGECDA